MVRAGAPGGRGSDRFSSGFSLGDLEGSRPRGDPAGSDPAERRSGSQLPVRGIMEFDSADLAALEASGQFENVILHEMGHVLGCGTCGTSKAC